MSVFVSQVIVDNLSIDYRMNLLVPKKKHIFFFIKSSNFLLYNMPGVVN